MGCIVGRLMKQQTMTHRRLLAARWVKLVILGFHKTTGRSFHRTESNRRFSRLFLSLLRRRKEDGAHPLHGEVLICAMVPDEMRRLNDAFGLGFNNRH